MQDKRIANPYELQAEMGLTKWAEFAVSRGFQPDDWIFGDGIRIANEGAVSAFDRICELVAASRWRYLGQCLCFWRHIMFAIFATTAVTLVLILIAFQVQRLPMPTRTIAKLELLVAAGHEPRALAD
jgi:hypothetical protein